MDVQLDFLVILRVDNLAQLLAKVLLFGRVEGFAAEVVGGPAADQDDGMGDREVLPQLGLDGVGLEPGEDFVPEISEGGVGVGCRGFDVHVSDDGDGGWGCGRHGFVRGFR